MNRRVEVRYPGLDAAATAAGCVTDEERDEYIAKLRQRVAELTAITEDILAEMRRARLEAARRPMWAWLFGR